MLNNAIFVVERSQKVREAAAVVCAYASKRTTFVAVVAAMREPPEGISKLRAARFGSNSHCIQIFKDLGGEPCTLNGAAQLALRCP